jgi:hypothetical protein
VLLGAVDEVIYNCKIIDRKNIQIRLLTRDLAWRSQGSSLKVQTFYLFLAILFIKVRTKVRERNDK